MMNSMMLAQLMKDLQVGLGRTVVVEIGIRANGRKAQREKIAS